MIYISLSRVGNNVTKGISDIGNAIVGELLKRTLIYDVL
jgi:hypothetical protein